MQGFQIVLERKGDDIFKNIFNCFRKKNLYCLHTEESVRIG